MNHNSSNIIYTDASYSPLHKIAIIGYKLNGKIHTKIIKNIQNTEAEFMAILFALKSIKINNHANIIVYTDCMRVIDLINKRNIKKHYHKTFLEKVDIITNITFNHINGHKKSALKDNYDKEFSELDNFVRKKLRSIIKKNMIHVDFQKNKLINKK